MCSLLHRILLLLSVVLCDGTRVIFKYDDIVTKTKVELKPVHISSALNDILVLVTPVVNCHEAKYHLHKPNGDVLRTEMTTPKNKMKFSKSKRYNSELPSRVFVKYINQRVKAIYPQHMYRIINLSTDEDEMFGDVLFQEEIKMNKNDFMVGPLLEEDHGNWVLSIYCKDIDGDWIEIFQVITIEIITYVQMSQRTLTNLPEGSTFHLSFLYPIQGLETCELNAPPSVTDRLFDRNQIELDKCGYVITNITRQDQGRWKVTGVGRIVYEGVVTLTIGDENRENNGQNYESRFSNDLQDVY